MSHGAMYLLPRTAPRRAGEVSHGAMYLLPSTAPRWAGRGSEPRSHVPAAEDSAAAGKQGK